MVTKPPRPEPPSATTADLLGKIMEAQRDNTDKIDTLLDGETKIKHICLKEEDIVEIQKSLSAAELRHSRAFIKVLLGFITFIVSSCVFAAIGYGRLLNTVETHSQDIKDIKVMIRDNEKTRVAREDLVMAELRWYADQLSAYRAGAPSSTTPR